jgi:hypothetical protein
VFVISQGDNPRQYLPLSLARVRGYGRVGAGNRLNTGG